MIAAFFLFSVGSVFANIVETRNGKMSGQEMHSRDGRAYIAWTKIPYAKPPVGPLRLAAPVPSNEWEGVFNATEPPPRCLQNISPILPNTFDGDEDCLYLNVFKPKIEEKDLPVLVYIHGGGFVLGPFANLLTGTNYLMDEDVIVVTLTYRLGTLGFMTMNDAVFPGNYGMKDQALALRWVKDNIQAFGGDPGTITTFGESAGGASSHSHLLSPLTKEIVQRAVAMSGVVTKIWSFTKPDPVVSESKRIAARLNCHQQDSAELLECLRRTDAAELSKIITTVKQMDNMKNLFFNPIIEPDVPGAFAPTDLTEVVSSKPLMVSFSSGEYLQVELPCKQLATQMGKKCNLRSKLRKIVSNQIQPERVQESWHKVNKRYFNSSSGEENLHESAILFQDIAYVFPAISVADAREQNGGPTWVSRMEYRAQVSIADVMGGNHKTEPTHGDDLRYLMDCSDLLAGPALAEDVLFSKKMVKRLVNFAKFGNPTPEGSEFGWRPYKGNEVLRLTKSGDVMADMYELRQLADFWTEIFDSKRL